MENHRLAGSKNITLVTTNLKGAEVSDHWADFEFNEDGTKLLRCAAGHGPKSSVYDKNTQRCKASFPAGGLQKLSLPRSMSTGRAQTCSHDKVAMRTAFHAKHRDFCRQMNIINWHIS